ncbi:Gfo/Idh/MocA family oxidoreductase [Photobacterium damselae subsp. damselae]|uniref:Gfo/Idh/MocA family protein n=1 Tax=Photobacterium damselae TaxID=38293 RepID=UPI001F1F2F74|nr:Gfo/Idh/MocA family oxidoreductase [Photobacterium damselae]UJZ94572.1 Gfo/Idh/MocA family oxidoreductase [Photobacterium damselae subsp. damselae]UJZ98555.1 Gfo/Idh/MocA family oxidoreductase [Photobacterium damselae subsp. damselae]
MFTKVAVVGLGNIATRHRKNLKFLFPNSTLFAMSASGRIPNNAISDCDHIAANITELIEANVELVIVASPAPFHAKHAIPFIESGIPTLIEKPVTTSSDDIVAIQKAIEKHGTPVSVGYCLHYLPSAKKIKSMLENGIIGRLYNSYIEIGQYLPDWRPSKDYRQCVSANENLGGGALFELSHELDYAQWLLGPLNLQHAILRSSEQLNLQVEDIADITASTNLGCIVSIHLDFIQRKAHRQCTIIGSEGRLDWDLIENKIEYSNKEETQILYCDSQWDKNQMYIEMITDFVEMIKNQSHSCTQVSDAASTVELIEQIKTSYNK